MIFRGTDVLLRGAVRPLTTSVAFAEFVKFLGVKYSEAAHAAIITHRANTVSIEYRAGEANAIHELHRALQEILREPANA